MFLIRSMFMTQNPQFLTLSIKNTKQYHFCRYYITPDQDKKVSATRPVNATDGGEAT